jgi:hypothetical protein
MFNIAILTALRSRFTGEWAPGGIPTERDAEGACRAISEAAPLADLTLTQD